MIVTQRVAGHDEPQEIRRLQRGDYFGEKSLLRYIIHCNANDMSVTTFESLCTFNLSNGAVSNRVSKIIPGMPVTLTE